MGKDEKTKHTEDILKMSREGYKILAPKRAPPPPPVAKKQLENVEVGSEEAKRAQGQLKPSDEELKAILKKQGDMEAHRQKVQDPKERKERQKAAQQRQKEEQKRQKAAQKREKEEQKRQKRGEDEKSSQSTWYVKPAAKTRLQPVRKAPDIPEGAKKRQAQQIAQDLNKSGALSEAREKFVGNDDAPIAPPRPSRDRKRQNTGRSADR